MERYMRVFPVFNVPQRRLRIFYSDTAVSLDLAADATFEDVARKLDELPNQGHGDPVAIDVTLRAAPHPVLFI
jgi:hypothetical protein